MAPCAVIGRLLIASAAVQLETDLAAQSLEPSTPPCWIDATPVPYSSLREADVAWERRVWRTIDLLDPANSPLDQSYSSSERCSDLITVLRNAMVNEGSITAYHPGPLGGDEAFSRPMDRDAVGSMLTALDNSTHNSITRLSIKEDWIFDKQRGVMEVRIIGWALLANDIGDDGELRGHRTICWLYFPECRHVLAHWACMIDAEGDPISFDTYFGRRLFRSVITKVSNGHDRTVNAYRAGTDALFESGAIREQLIDMGFDLWHY